MPREDIEDIDQSILFNHVQSHSRNLLERESDIFHLAINSIHGPPEKGG